MINKQRMLAEFYELVKIKCSSRDEREIADVLKAKLAALGCTVTEDDCGDKIGGSAGNVIAYLKGTTEKSPVIFLSAHMDCVEPCGNIEPVLKDGIITSKGDTVLGSDDKAGVEAILEALRYIKDNQLPHGDVQIIFTICEEGGLLGSRFIDKANLKADFGYVMDSSGAPGEIIVEAPGQNKITAVIHGKKAHAGIAPENGINAIVLAGKALAEIKYGRIDSETTANIGIIKGGNATNIVPDKVEVFCEARSRNNEKLDVQTKSMVETFEKVAAANGGKAEVEVKRSYDAYVLSPDAPVVALAVKAAEKAGLKPVLKGTGGGSDANNFSSYGIPATVLGVGMTKVHTNEEYIKEEDLYGTAELVVALITTVAEA